MKKNILLSISFLFFSMGYVFFDVFNMQNIASESVVFSTIFNSALIIELIKSFFIIIAIHIAIAFFANFLNKSLSKNNNISLITSWLLIITFIISLSSIYFPLLKTSINESIAIYTLTLSSLIIILIFFHGINKLNKSKKTACLLVTLLVFLIPLKTIYFKHDDIVQENNDVNVFYIGIDSLRPDYNSSTLTPFINQWTENAIEIPNTTTPIARTFPSWVGILTGIHPINTKIRFNLTDKGKLDNQYFIGNILSKENYKTIFAQDERRFSNIDEQQGFSEIIGPPASASEFLLSNLSQLPQIALATQIPIIDTLFPFIKANRGAYRTYIPSDFTNKIDINLVDYKNKPLFLATHLTLPHYPFSYNRPVYLEHEEFNPDFAYQYMYKAMLNSVDKQLSNLLDILKKKGLLKNAIVILLSDHGESFGLENDGPKPKYEFASFETNSAGHGTNVLSQSQFNVYLSARLFGKANRCKNLFKSKESNKHSLLDITPTVLKCLNISSNQLDGFIINEVDNERSLFLESSINPIVLSKNRINKIQTLANGVKFYTINDNGKVIVKPEIYAAALSSKQRSILYKEFSLAIYPDINDDLIFVEHKLNQWQPASMYKDKKIIRKMFLKLCKKYEVDVNDGLIEQCSKPEQFLKEMYKKWEH
jgi:hypothetical protein